MKTQSAKAKGRRLQKEFRNLLIEKLNIHPEDIESRSMGASGEDLIMDPEVYTRKVCPTVLNVRTLKNSTYGMHINKQKQIKESMNLLS